MLPHVALLEIFSFYSEEIDAWHTLVHVCRYWRDLVFGSPRRLGLRLWYKARTPVKDMLDIWPPIPISIWIESDKWQGVKDDNIITALEHNDRVREFDLSSLLDLQLGTFFASNAAIVPGTDISSAWAQI